MIHHMIQGFNSILYHYPNLIVPFIHHLFHDHLYFPMQSTAYGGALRQINANIYFMCNYWGRTAVQRMQ